MGMGVLDSRVEGALTDSGLGNYVEIVPFIKMRPLEEEV